jgi:para-aminobenzoate synthetase component 1
LLHWAAAQSHCVFLDTCDTTVDQYGQYDFLLGVARKASPVITRDLASLEAAVSEEPLAWRFGFLGYELKAEIEPRLRSELKAAVDVGPMEFFVADVVISKRRGSDMLVFELGFSEQLVAEIKRHPITLCEVHDFTGFVSNFSEEEYCATIAQLRAHIHAGDCYEINLSQNFTAQVGLTAPAALWEDLVAASPVPFAGFGKWGTRYLMCASPERFLQLRSGQLLTQPIKGTAPRGADTVTDAALADQLRNSQKEQAENVMIVDLSRNDLHRSCEAGTVEVPHLFEVQQFPQVHHLVSTIKGTKRKGVHPVEAIRNTFPPGSMTGAPKVRTCELIAQYERSARGIYAGAFGYIAPGGDFDLNVVIRSLAYDATTQQLSYHVGGAITWDSDPAAEYAETILKATAISRLFQGR